MVRKPNKRILITLGDTRGIGPEVISGALRRVNCRSSLVVLGDRRHQRFFDLPVVSTLQQSADPPRSYYPVPVTGRPASYHLVRIAAEAAVNSPDTALVTGPVSKEEWGRAGIPHRGHTGLLAELAGVSEYAMLFWAENLKTALFTTHLPLRQIFSRLTRKRLAVFIRLVSRELRKWFKADFDFLVSGLNPHAGERGFLGQEETEIITPVIESLCTEMKISGPYPPDTVFRKALNNPRAVVISIYHDQGLIPFKLLNFEKGVNLTLGLPYIRTSPDHGPARDIAGRQAANPESMRQAIVLADRLLNSDSE